MIITCPCGKKKFELDASLIPPEGKMLQCGPCSKKWFYKNTIKQEKELPQQLNESSQINENTELPKQTESIIEEAENNYVEKEIKAPPKEKVSFFYIFLILIISFVAMVIILDTFKISINNILPGFIFFLDNFYLSLNDLLLIIKDLIRND